MKRVDDKRMLRLIHRAVEERGEGYVYPAASPEGGGCVYYRDSTEQEHVPTDEFIVNDGDPACLIGLIISYVAPEALTWMFEDGGAAIGIDFDSTGAREVLKVINSRKEFGVHFTETAIELAQCAQTDQDSQLTWGCVEQRAQNYVKGVPA